MVSDQPCPTLDDLLRLREPGSAPSDYLQVMTMTGRQARVLLGMPGRTINKARVAPVEWRGRLIRVVGL